MSVSKRFCVLVTLFTLVATAFANGEYGGFAIGSGRALPSVAALIGLVSVAVGAVAVARSARSGALVALSGGAVSLVIGGLHAANSAGGFGTGNGLAGAIVAIGLGVVAISLGGLAMARVRSAPHD
jgi:hypothetical protein